jgi:hypothetical protein
MPRIRLIHWNTAEGDERAAELRRWCSSKHAAVPRTLASFTLPTTQRTLAGGPMGGLNDLDEAGRIVETRNRNYLAYRVAFLAACRSSAS